MTLATSVRARRCSTASRGACRGQVVPFSAAFLLLCAALFYFMVNTGQVAAEKTRVLNAADAAAYSAGVVQARGLNYAAYANRAIIANQVAIAQTLTLVNFLNYAGSLYTATDADGEGIDDLSEGIAWATPPSDPERYGKIAGLLAGSLIAQYYGFDPDEFIGYLEGLDGMGAVIIKASDAASGILDGSVASMLGGGGVTLLERSRAVAQEVAQRMDPAMRAEINPIGGVGWIVKRYEDDERTRAQDMVLRSLDDGVRKRDWKSVSTASRALGGTGLYRRGATWMPDLDHWKSSDSLSYKYIRWTWRGPRLRERRIAWSDAVSGTQDGPEATYRYRGSEGDETREVNAFTAAVYSGMASVYDIEDPANTDAVQHRASVSVLVRKAKSDTNTAGHDPDISPTGRLALFSDDPPVDRLSGLSRAEILYHAPPRGDGKSERPNLFNPYWTVRLARPTAVDDAFAGIASGLRYWP